MGWNDDEIDDLFRKASESQQATYEDAYWKEMEALLDAEKPTKKRGLWWFFGTMTVVLLLGIVGTGFYTLMKQTKAEQNAIASAQQPTIDNNSLQGEFEFKTFIDKEEQKSENTELSSIVDTKPIVQREHRVSLVALAEAQEKILKNIKNNEVAIDNSQLKSSVNTTTNNQIQQEKNTLTETVKIATNIEQHIPTNDTEEVESVAKNHLDTDTTLEQITTKEQEKTEEQEATAIAQIDPLAKRKTGFYAGVSAGAGTSYIKSSQDLLVQWGVNMGFDYTIANRLRLGAGIGFRQQMVNNLELKRSREYYSLGLINIQQEIKYDRLQFVDVSIHAHYLFKRMAIGVEFTPSYLMSARAQMDQNHVQDGKTIDEGLTYSTDKKFVRTDNFNPFGIDAGLSFQYEFKHKVCLKLGANARLNQFIANKDFEGTYNKLPMRLELGLIKRF